MHLTSVSPRIKYDINPSPMNSFFASVFLCLSVFFRSRCNLGLEILALRQQLGVLNRKHPRPRLRTGDRLFWVLLHWLWPGWSNALVVVKPETVVAWHRAGFRLFWRFRSRSKKRGRPQNNCRASICNPTDDRGECNLGRSRNSWASCSSWDSKYRSVPFLAIFAACLLPIKRASYGRLFFATTARSSQLWISLRCPQLPFEFCIVFLSSNMDDARFFISMSPNIQPVLG